MPSGQSASVQGVAWITGASSGIGRATALELANRGWLVAVTARNIDELQSLMAQAPPGRIALYPADVTDADAIAATVGAIEAERGAITLAMLNAGLYLPVRATRLDPALFRKSFEVNVQGTVHGLSALVPRMIARGRGQIWLMASTAGYGPLPTSAAYGATKAALINMAGSLKFDLDLYGVHIGVINPGFVDTPATRKNPFAMPFLISVEEAGKRIVDGFAKPRFEIAFPRRFALILKALNLLPYAWYFPLASKMMRWDKVGRETPKDDAP